MVTKKLFFEAFSKTLAQHNLEYYSFFPDISPSEELSNLFTKMIENYGEKHLPVYRLCDAEYMYILGRRLPRKETTFYKRLSFILKSILIHLNIINQKTWHGENYSLKEKRKLRKKYLEDLKSIAKCGFLAPHLILSESRFCEEYNEEIIRYFNANSIDFFEGNYLPFYFVYIFLSDPKYKKQLFKGKNILVLTSFNERKLKSNFEFEFQKEGVANVFFYEISPNKSMFETIDLKQLPDKVDLALIGAGIGSANIINQLTSLKALCIDAGHALDCFSIPELRYERPGLLPD